MRKYIMPSQSEWLSKHGIDILNEEVNLQGLLAMLPKKITDRQRIYELKIGVDHYSEEWYVKYENFDNSCDDLESFVSAKELIDAVFTAIVWVNTDERVKALD